MESSVAKKKTAKKTIPTKTGVNSAGDRLKRLKENRDGSPARKPPKITKDAIREGCEELKLLQKERVERKIPLTETENCLTEHFGEILGLAVDSKQIETELKMDLPKQGVGDKEAVGRGSNSNSPVSKASALDSSSGGESYVSCSEDENGEVAAADQNSTFTIVKEAENSGIASSAFFTTCVDEAMELSDSINEEVQLTAAILNDQSAMLTQSSNSHRIKTLNTDQDTSIDSLGECSMEDSVKNDSGLFNEPPPEFVNSTADLSQRNQELREEIAPDEGQNDVELMELTKPAQDGAGLIVAEAVGSEYKNDLDQEDLEMEKEKENNAADEEEINDSWFAAKIFEDPSNEKENSISCTPAACKVPEGKAVGFKNQLEEECEQDRTPGPNTDKKQKANEQMEEKNCTQPPTDGAATLKTPADRHLQCLEERPAPEILWSKPQKSQDSKSSGSSKSRLPTFSLMIPARSTSTPINRFKAAFSNADHRQGTPRPPKAITFKTPDNLNVEIPVINSKSKYADVKSKISTRWAPGRLKRPREEEPDEKLQQPSENLKSVKMEWSPSSKVEKAAALTEAHQSTEVVVHEHVPVPDFREEAKCAPLQVNTKQEVEPETPKEERMITTEKVLFGAAALGALTMGGYITFRNWDKVVEKTSSFFNTLTIEFK